MRKMDLAQRAWQRIAKDQGGGFGDGGTEKMKINGFVAVA